LSNTSPRLAVTDPEAEARRLLRNAQAFYDHAWSALKEGTGTRADVERAEAALREAGARLRDLRRLGPERGP
jgi:outer membrane protein TolC